MAEAEKKSERRMFPAVRFKIDRAKPFERQTNTPYWLEDGAEVWVSIRRAGLNEGRPCFLRCIVTRAFGDAATLESTLANYPLVHELWSMRDMLVHNDSPWAR